MKTKPRPSTVVYFVRCELNGLIKIGVAENLERRLAGLKAQSPVPLELLATIPSGGSYDVESALHRRFAEYRHHGEWFEVSDGLDDLIESLRAGGPSSDAAGTSPGYSMRFSNITPGV